MGEAVRHASTRLFGMLPLLLFVHRTSAATYSGGPNFVIFQPDDIPFYWDDAPTTPAGKTTPTRVSTPYMDKIRSEGVTFTRAYTASPMCAPSRLGVLTGRYPSRSQYGQAATVSCLGSSTVTQVTVSNSKLDDTIDSTYNIQTALSAAGYTTGAVGKWHLHSEGSSCWLPITTQYSSIVSKAKGTGFDTVDGVYCGNFNTIADLTTVGFSHNMDWVAAAALDFLDAATTKAKPFFLYMNPTIPHGPSANTSLNDWASTATPSGTLSSAPSTGTMASRASVYTRATAYKSSIIDNAVGVTWLDDALGAVLDRLTANGVSDNTLVLCIMDHGVMGKGLLYETGGRIAMFARYPAHPYFTAGKTISSVVSNIDIAPTLLELAGTSMASSHLDGTSLLAAINGTTSRNYVVVELDKDRAVVTSKYKYLHMGVEAVSSKACGSREGAGYSTTAYPYASSTVQLYDLSADPTEQTALDTTSFATTVSTMQGYLTAHLAATAISYTVAPTPTPTKTPTYGPTPKPTAAPVSTSSPTRRPASKSDQEADSTDTMSPSLTSKVSTATRARRSVLNTTPLLIALVLALAWLPSLRI